MDTGENMSNAAALQGRSGVRPSRDDFYFYMAIVAAAIAFLGFAPTYWLPVVSGQYKAAPIIHIHGLVFSAWALFVVWQMWLAASGRLVRHRTMGLVGIALATMMTMLGLLATIRQMKAAESAGLGAAAETFSIVPLSAIVFFAIVFALAVANVRNTDVHKRLMLLAMIAVLEAPIARWFLVFLAPPAASGPPPIEVTLAPAFLAYALIGVAMYYDWRTIGRPHPVCVIGAGVLVAWKLLQIPVSATAVWHGVAGWLSGLAA